MTTVIWNKKRYLRVDFKSRKTVQQGRLTTMLPVVAICALFAWATFGALTARANANTDSPKSKPDQGVLSTLRHAHPRLMLSDSELSALKKRYHQDKLLKRYVNDVLETADKYCNASPLIYKKIGPRLLHVSRSCLRRVYPLAFAWRWTGKEKYAIAARANLLTVCAFKDWNPAHFLDVAEMSHAVGVGYDWLYNWLDSKARDKIKAGLIKNAMLPGLQAYRGMGAWFVRSDFNWNQVCNDGLIIGSLAIAQTDPQYARVIIPAALKSLPRAIRNYAPDGAWPEGPSYWYYAMRYTAYGITALQTALRKDFGLTSIKGLSQAGYFPIYLAGPTGLYMNYADCGLNSHVSPMPCMFWLAETYKKAIFATFEKNALTSHRANTFDIIWYIQANNIAGDSPKNKGQKKILDKYFRGKVEIVTMRSSWNDKNALFVGVKAGYNQVNHGHLDLGNFVLDALGQRWASDLGSDNYNLPGYWSMGKGGQRWSYYRLNSQSHNVVMLAGKSQNVYGTAQIIKFNSAPNYATTTIDLTEAYKPWSHKSTRKVSLTNGRRAVLIEDNFELNKPYKVLWGMTTAARIKITPHGSAQLKLKGKTLIAHILKPAGAKFTVESARQKPPQATNTGYNRLVIQLTKAKTTKGKLEIKVLLSPVWSKYTHHS